MEDMEIDQIVDVPDTPDRLNTRHVGRKYVRDLDAYVNEKRVRDFPVAENGKNGRLNLCPLKNSNSGEMNNCIAVSPSKKSYAPQNPPIFRRSQTDKILGHGLTHSNGSEKMEKGKAICNKSPSKLSSHGRGGVAVFDLTNENGQPPKPRPVFSHLGLKDNATENKKELKTSIGNSSIPCIPDSSNTSSNTFVGKCKIESKTLPCSNISVDHGKSIDQSSNSQEKTDQQTSLPPHLLAAPRFRRQKRLVRNGCISPHNIAARAKQSAEQNSQRTNDVEQRHPEDALFPISINDIVAEERSSGRVKGKELLIHPSSEYDTGTIHTASSTPLVNDEEANGTSNAIRSSLESFGGSGGWRTTHNRRNMDQPLHDVTGHHSRRDNDAESFISTQYRNRVDRRNIGSSQSSKEVPYPLETSHATSLIIPDAEQLTRPCPTADKLTKRQRKIGSTSRSPNSEIMILDLHGESSNSSSSSRSSVLDTEIAELLPETTYTNRLSNNLDDMNNDDSDARARQLEADERLARELQEQLYHEDYFGGGEIDEHFAWELQHEEDLLHTSIENHHISHPRWLSREPSNRQLRSRPHQSPTNRRRAGPNASLPNRISQVRSRILNRSSTPATTRGRPTTARERRIRFPVEMDFDMRLDILEALEDAVGDIGDMGVSDDIFHAHRDFNE